MDNQKDNQPITKDKLTEKDLLKICMEKPHYLSKVLGHEDNTTGLDTSEQKKEFIRYMYRAWSGMTKYLYMQVVKNQKCVDFPLVGRFYLRQAVRKDLSPKNQQILNKNKVDGTIVFVPHLDFIESGKFQFP